MVEFDDVIIKELLDEQHKEISTKADNWTCEGSGWTLHSILRLVVSEITPCEES